MFQKERQKEQKITVLIVALFFNLFLMSSNIILKNKQSLFHNIISSITSPFQIGFQKAIDFISFEIKHYIFLKNTFNKYHVLKKKITKLKYENYILRKKIEELGFLESVEKKYDSFIVAEVISIDSSIPFNSVFINKGSKDGMKKNMVVLNKKAELVGKVVEPITWFTSKVRLITSNISGVGAYIKDNKLEGLLTGNNNKLCNFNYLIETMPVKIDDLVITSGTDKIFPSYISIGKVIKIIKGHLMQEVYVKPFFTKESIKQLIIIKDEE